MLDEAFWLAGLRNVHSEHFEMGVEPHAASYFYGKARLTWGLGHRPNIVMEFNADQQKCKEIAFQLHRNVRRQAGGSTVSAEAACPDEFADLGVRESR